MSVVLGSHTLPAGARVGCHVIEDVIGRGSFGITYRAFDTSLHRRVAIKEYFPQAFAGRESTLEVTASSATDVPTFEWGLERFTREARTLARFTHPGIVRVLAVLREHGTAYMVMELLDGHLLGDVLKRRQSVDEALLKRLVHPIIDGLAQVHASGFIHRDIKPNNIQVRRDGSPVLLDFGSARHTVGDESGPLTTLVTEGYAPPEQYAATDSHLQGPWTDIYALGAVLHYGVVGHTPVASTLRSSAVFNDEEDPLQPLVGGTYDGCYSRPFLQAIDWALCLRYGDRPQSLDDWREAVLAESAPRRPERVEAHADVGHRRAVASSSTDASAERMRRPSLVRPQKVLRSAREPRSRSLPDAQSASGDQRTRSRRQRGDRPSAADLAVGFWSRLQRRRRRRPYLLGIVVVLVMAVLARVLVGPGSTPIESDDGGASSDAETADRVATGSPTLVAPERTSVATARPSALTPPAQLRQRDGADDAPVREPDSGSMAGVDRQSDTLSTASVRRAPATGPDDPVAGRLGSTERDQAGRRFMMVARSLEAVDRAAFDRLTRRTETDNPLFRHLFENFESIETRLDEFRAIPRQNRVTATLLLEWMHRANGDRVRPAPSFQRIPVMVERTEAGWSAVVIGD